MKIVREVGIVAVLAMGAVGCGVASQQVVEAPGTPQGVAHEASPSASSEAGGASQDAHQDEVVPGAARPVEATPADLARVTDATRKVNSARFEMRVEGGEGAFGTADALVATGAFDLQAKASSMTFDAGDVGKMELRVVDGKGYVNFGGLLGSGGPKWMAFDLTDLGSDKKLASGGLFDPTSVLAQLKAVTGEVTVVGTETLDGVATTHYHAEVDLAKVLADHADELSPGGKADLSEQLAQLGSGAPTVIPVDVWVGDDGLPRQYRMSMTADDIGTLTTTITFSGFGEPVTVVAPPADQVVSGKDALGNMLGSFADSATS